MNNKLFAYFFVSALILLFVGCGGNSVPKGFPKKNEMAKIIAELSIYESMINNSASGVRINSDEIPALYKGVLDKYGYNYEQFDTIRKWYIDHPQLYKEVYEKVIEILSRRESDIQKLLAAEQAESERIEAEQRKRRIEFWKDSSITVTKNNDSIDRRLPFEVNLDSITDKGTMQLSASYRFLREDESKKPIVFLTFHYDSIRIDTVTYDIEHSFAAKNVRLNYYIDQDVKPQKLSGFLMYQDSTLISAYSINQLSLILYKDSLIETISYVDSLTKRPEISDTTKKIDNIAAERKLELQRGMVR